ncbi:DUF167 domain-containing protein [Nitrosophilus kaiyonis]|uniref:DUF167 domain-containing protein n=1 Tax=Nitrosophilus kaiyonis TaxID=2930200 RepID=UPI002491082B|nr:DUF167 domain-containing protein [Nitrosophilus kaiyonis]
MWFEKKDNYVIFYIKAQPNSSQNKIAGIYGDSLKINIKAPAVEGAANKELIKFLSKTFKIAKSEIEFISGKTSKRKAVKLPLNEKVEELIVSLK